MNWKTPILKEVNALEKRGLRTLNDAWPVWVRSPESRERKYRLKVLASAISHAEKRQMKADKAAERNREKQIAAVQREQKRLAKLEPYAVLNGVERRVNLVLMEWSKGQSKVWFRTHSARASLVLEPARVFARSLAARGVSTRLTDAADGGMLEEEFS